MYIPKTMKMDNTAQAQDLIDEFGFGVLICGSLSASHLPLLLDRDEGELGTLYGHFARANPHWKSLQQQPVMVVFSGPHSYISPTWYARAPAVPTWNYAAVHAHGVLSRLDDRQTLAVVEQAVQKYEPELLHRREILTQEFQDRLLQGIVGFKIALTALEGKLKLGQHRSAADQQGVYAALSQSERPDHQALAEYMRKLAVGTGRD